MQDRSSLLPILTYRLCLSCASISPMSGSVNTDATGVEIRRSFAPGLADRCGGLRLMSDRELDDLELPLVGALQYAPRASLEFIGTVIGATQRTVRHPYNELLRMGLVGVTCEVDWPV